MLARYVNVYTFHKSLNLVHAYAHTYVHACSAALSFWIRHTYRTTLAISYYMRDAIPNPLPIPCLYPLFYRAYAPV